MKTGQTHVHKYMEKLMGLIEEGKIDPTVVISHRTADLGEGPGLYKTFRGEERWLCQSRDVPARRKHGQDPRSGRSAERVCMMWANE